MDSRHAELYAQMRTAILETPGDASLDVRREVEARAASLSGRAGEIQTQSDPVGAYVDKVAQHAYRVVDEDVAALKAAGQSEDAIFELTLAAALGAAAGRFECAQRALEGLA